MIPPEFTGVWRRVSIAIGDGPPAEPSDVVWLQARCAFGDLRLPRRPGTAAEAFAGETTWDPPCLRWTHDLDLDPEPAGTDVGVVEWHGDDLVERGTVGDTEVGYEEVWRRDPDGARHPILVLAHAAGDDRGSIVRVGDHAIVMLRVAGTVAVRHDVLGSTDAWVTVGALGELPLPPVPVAAPDWQHGACVELPGFGTWSVRELEG